jgi:hypothetical protein
MPIRTELRPLYGRTWRRFRAAVIAVHGVRCSRCGRACPRYLNFAHRYHDPAHSGVIDRLCASCHSKQDARHSYAVRRRSRARRTGQLWLMPELEYAPYAASEIPPRVLAALRAAAQRGLFE